MKLSSEQFLQLGLAMLGFHLKYQEKVCAAKLEAFVNNFGSHPLVLEQIWKDMLETDIDEARIDPKKDKPEHFLVGMYFIRVYPTKTEFYTAFKISSKTCALWANKMVLKVQALLPSKIYWPKEWGANSNTPKFLISVDGVHFWIKEPLAEANPKNKVYYSHKDNRAGLAYEIALSIWSNQIVWVSKPYPASVHDITIFRENLKQKLPKGSVAIADQGYRGEKDCKTSIPNSLDTPEVKELKGRAKARQESVNSRIKVFQSLKEMFRHDIETFHQSVVECVLTVTQYQMENGSPLFAV